MPPSRFATRRAFRPTPLAFALLAAGLVLSMPSRAACTFTGANTTVPAGEAAAGQILYVADCTGLTQNTFGVHGVRIYSGGFNLRYVVQPGATVRATGNGGDAFSGVGLSNTTPIPYLEIINRGTVEATGTGAAGGAQLNENIFQSLVFRNYGVFQATWIAANPAALQKLEWHSEAGSVTKGALMALELSAPSVLLNNSGLIEGTTVQSANTYYTLAANPYAKPTSTLAVSLIGGTTTFNQLAGEIRGDVFAGYGGAVRMNVLGGTINGDTYLSAGDDEVDLAGGAVNGDIRTQNGNDTVTVRSGTALAGLIGTGNGSDTLNLHGANLGAIPLLDGGDDASAADGFVDTVNFNGITTAMDGARLVNWERIRLNTGSQLTLTGQLVTGTGQDSASQPLGLLIDPTSTLRVGAPAVGITGDVHNAGTINLQNGTPGNVLTINGSYFGNNGVLRVGTVLGNSSSLSDRLVIHGASSVASGSTTVQVVNVGGLGAQTTGQGIQVVGVTGGASMGSATFNLAGGHVDAGAYEYRLNSDSTGAYLSSQTTEVVVPPIVTPPVVTPPGTTPPVISPPAPAPVPAARPAYRAEVPLDTALPAVLRQVDLAMLSNLHRRVGDEATAGDRTSGALRNTTRAWGRVIGGNTTITQGGTTAPESRTRFGGFQTGVDLFADDRWNAGLYFGKLRSDASVRGIYGLSPSSRHAGSMRADSYYVGGYATYANAEGLYVDTVLQYGIHDLSATSVNDRRIGSDGKSITASVEVGKRWPMSEHWALEPQAQLIFNRQSLEDTQIAGLTTVRRDTANAWVGRLGVRLAGDLGTAFGRLRPYARLNLWHGFSGTDRATFSGGAGSTRFDNRIGYTSIELAAGATLALSATTSLYGEFGSLRQLGGGGQKVRSSVQGSAGVRLRF